MRPGVSVGDTSRTRAARQQRSRNAEPARQPLPPMRPEEFAHAIDSSGLKFRAVRARENGEIGHSGRGRRPRAEFRLPPARLAPVGLWLPLSGRCGATEKRAAQQHRETASLPPASALDAVGMARQRCWRRDWVLDLDIKAFFDSIGVPLSRPMMLPSAICIGAFSHLSMYKSAHGQSVCLRTSPLLSNLYLNEVDRMLERAREVTRNGKYTYIEYARFADDLVILVDAYKRVARQSGWWHVSTLIVAEQWRSPGPPPFATSPTWV
jgi:Reverse transcriptase (RNA-dependent DNA polymerase)